VADIEHFSQARLPGASPAEMRAIHGPKLGYIGVLSDYKLDFTLVTKCAMARPDWNWIFIGEEPERQASAHVVHLRTLPNVYFLGYKSYDILPDYLREIDIAVLPNLTTGYMSGVFPMKLYEYLAAGKPVISTPIDALADLGDIIAMAQGASLWIAEIEKKLALVTQPIDLDDPNLSEFSWDKRLDRMLEVLKIPSDAS
jgi:glycosyltransferase involved in cell wall biosynthesis